MSSPNPLSGPLARIEAPRAPSYGQPPMMPLMTRSHPAPTPASRFQHTSHATASGRATTRTTTSSEIASRVLGQPQVSARLRTPLTGDVGTLKFQMATDRSDESSLVPHYTFDPMDDLAQRVADNMSKIHSIESDIKHDFSESTVSLSAAKKSALALGKDHPLNKLMHSLDPETRELLEELTKTSGSNSATPAQRGTPSTTASLTLTPTLTAATTGPYNRIQRVLHHLSASAQPAPASLAPANTSASTPANSSSDINVMAALMLLPFRDRLKLWELTHLRRSVAALEAQQKTQSVAIVDSTKRHQEEAVRDRFVLAIDGGGVRGKIPALVLDYIEKRTQRPIHELFDLVTGTSTGAILALGATIPGTDRANRDTPYSASEMVKIYDDYGSTIFGRSPLRYATSSIVGAIGGLALSQLSRGHHYSYSPYVGLAVGALGGIRYRYKGWDELVSTKYSRDGLEQVVNKFFASRKLSNRVMHMNRGLERKIELLIPTCLSVDRTPLLFDSVQCNPSDPMASAWTQFTTMGYNDLPIRSILLSTTAAPSYFPPYKFEWELGADEVLDGGICFNNPALLGYTRAKKLWPGDRVHLLSLGTGYTPGSLGSSGTARIGANLVNGLFQAQSYATSKFLASLRGRVGAPFPVTDIVGILDHHQVTKQLSSQLTEAQRSLAVRLSYDPIESYVRVDGKLKSDMELDDASQMHLLAEDSQRFINEANEKRSDGRQTLDNFWKVMKKYHQTL